MINVQLSVRKLASLLALVIGISVATACGGGNPLKPEPTCQDQSALNYGGPLPCQPKPVTFSATRLWITGASPVAGSDVKLAEFENGTSGLVIGGTRVTIKVGFEIAEEHLNFAKSKGYDIGIHACLSVDGTEDARFGCGQGPKFIPSGVNKGVDWEFNELILVRGFYPPPPPANVFVTKFVRLHIRYRLALGVYENVIPPVPIEHPYRWSKQ